MTAIRIGRIVESGDPLSILGGPGCVRRQGVGGCHAARRCLDGDGPVRAVAGNRVAGGHQHRISLVVLVVQSFRRGVMTREQVVQAETIAMADARRMVATLGRQAHDEGNARVSKAVRERSKAQESSSRPAAMAWSPDATH